MQQHRDRTHNACNYRRKPTPAPGRALETVLWRCRDLDTAGLHERKAAWEQRRVCVTVARHSAQVPASTEVRPA